MLQKSRSKTSIKLKYLVIFPILTALVILSSCITDQEERVLNPPVDLQPKAQNYVTETDVPFKKVDKLPTTKTCQWIKNRTDQEKCVSNEINDYVHAYFNVKAVSKYANPGINRIYVRFKIDTNGKIIDVQSRGPAPELEKEAIRVVSSIPQMIPGEHKGQKVNVLYSLPIVFEKESSDVNTSTSSTSEDIAILTEKLNDNSIEKGYYLITGIFKSEKYLEKGVQRLKEKNLNPQVFQNPKDNYYYMYLEKFNNAADAKKSLASKYDGKYQDDLYILKIQ